jgi:hypothetical protein
LGLTHFRAWAAIPGLSQGDSGQLSEIAPMTNLPHELLLSTVLVGATVLIHLAGLDLLLSLTGLHLRFLKTAWVRLDRLLVPLGIVLGLFVLHGLEIWLYALVYLFMGLQPDLESALYLSTSTYSTLGEAGAAAPAGWRVFSVLEAINGLLLIGWSTAFLFQILDHLLAVSDHEIPRGVISHKHRRRPGRAARAAQTQPLPDGAGEPVAASERGGKGAPAGTN